MYSSVCPCPKTVFFEWKVLFLPQAISFIALGLSFCVAFVSTASHMNIVQMSSRPTVFQTTFHVNNNQTSHINIDQKTFVMKDIQTTQHIASIDQTTFHMNNNQTTTHMNVAQKTFMMKDIQTTSHMNAAQIVFHLSVIWRCTSWSPTSRMRSALSFTASCRRFSGSWSKNFREKCFCIRCPFSEKTSNNLRL